MTMTNAEIVADYRQARNKRAQIGILADLNSTDAGTIMDILREAGELIPRDRLDSDKEGSHRQGARSGYGLHHQRRERLAEAQGPAVQRRPGGSGRTGDRALVGCAGGLPAARRLPAPPPVSCAAACCGTQWRGVVLVQQATNPSVQIRLDRGRAPMTMPVGRVRTQIELRIF